jgi:ParB family transcriptional regulator, chromosome partitioning protein
MIPCSGFRAPYEAYNRKPRALAHADRIAEVLDLDMVAAGWIPTVENYLGRVTKARILGAVREARGERAARLIDHLKKTEMAEKAQELLAGSGWLPEPLRTPGRASLMSSRPRPSNRRNPPINRRAQRRR